MNPTVKATIATLLVGSVTLMTASGPSIGMATASGSFRVNNSSVNGSASVLDGMRVGTDGSPSYLVLDGGSQLSLSERSSGQVYRDRLVLEQGSLRIDRANNFQIDTATVRVMPSDAGSKVRVIVGAQNRVSVDVLSGEARVTNLKGVEVARVYPGEARSFGLPPIPPQAGAAAVTRMTGCVHKVTVNGKVYYILGEATSRVQIEVDGALASTLAGKYVEIDASPNATATPVKDATQVVDVVKVVSEKKQADCNAGGWWRAAVLGVPAGVLVGGVAVTGVSVGILAAKGVFSSGGPIAGGSISVP